MIARLYVAAPFVLSVPEGTVLKPHDCEVDGYPTRFFAPESSAAGVMQTRNWRVKIGGVPASQADLIHIDFEKETFDRAESVICDPPYEVIQRALASYILRLRHVTKASVIQMIPFPMAQWEMLYLNDDSSELDLKEGLVRRRWAQQTWISCTALTESMWEGIHSLPIDYCPTPWASLLLDATNPGTAPGNAIVLSVTALEVFISTVLEKLAVGTVKPNGLWEWIDNRSDWRKEPSVAEQYDALLEILTGHSLKEDPKLWQAFQNLRNARNSFVHQGLIRLGENSPLLHGQDVAELVSAASLTISKVREWLPADLHWTERKYDSQLEVLIQIGPNGKPITSPG